MARWSKCLKKALVLEMPEPEVEHQRTSEGEVKSQINDFYDEITVLAT